MSRKKTHEEYVAELAIKNPTVEVVGTYIDAKTKITHHCLVHDVYWDALPGNVLRGKGCKECMKEKNRNHFLKSQEEYVQQVAKVAPYIIVLEEYCGNDVPISHLCTKHNVEWMARPSSIFNGSGCPKCGKEKFHEKRCKKREEYVAELAIANPTAEVIGEYIDNKTEILHHCLIHDTYWKIRPANALMGKGCPECHKERIGRSNAMSQKEYVKRLQFVNPDIIIIGKYINNLTPTLHKCLIDGCEWYATPAHVLYGTGCPQCNETIGERIVRQWLESHNINYEFQKRFDDCRNVYSLPFDFYLPKYNVCIEYQGGQHYFPVEKFGGQEQFELQIKRDKIKSDYCKQNNIRLLCVKYDEDINEVLTNFLFI